MSLDTPAGRLADRLMQQEYVEIFTHHDADGIAAAAILCIAMLRAGTRFRVRAVREIGTGEIRQPGETLLCDLGAGMEDLPAEVMVIDHHEPLFTGPMHVNPRLSGIDGDRELSAAGTAFLVTQAMGDNRDLAGLALLGMIGDRQELAGPNREIFSDAVAEGLVEPDRGLRLAGRDTRERLLLATSPYLPGISGDEAAVGRLLDSGGNDEGARLDFDLSSALLAISRHASAASMLAVYGDRFRLGREVIRDAHTLTALVDACGKSGYPGLAVSLCIRSAAGIDEAFSVMAEFRKRVIAAVTASVAKTRDGVWEVGDPAVASDVADILAFDIDRSGPVLVWARDGEACLFSARCPGMPELDLGAVVRRLAAENGGTGGGHRTRAGATIGCSDTDSFVKGFLEAVVA
jgi:single-stranded-DNA-specific exonuclease